MAVERWNSRKVSAKIANRIVRKMKQIGVLVEGGTKRKLSVGQPVRRTSGGRLVGLDPSRPGEPPRVVSSRLRQSITHKVTREGREVFVRIGTNVEYARRQELGFVGTDSLGRNVHHAPRPFLRPSLREKIPTIKRILRG